MNKSEKKLIRLYDALAPAEREMLSSFAEFLVTRTTKNQTIEEPVEIKRPPEESIVAAIKRLSASYPMLNKSKLLSDVSEKVTQHVVYGRKASDVIDELEVFFQQNYVQYVSEKENLMKENEMMQGETQKAMLENPSESCQEGSSQSSPQNSSQNSSHNKGTKQ